MLVGMPGNVPKGADVQISEEMVEIVQQFIASKQPHRVTLRSEIQEMLQHVVALGWLSMPLLPALDVELSKEEDDAIRDVIARQRRAYKTAISVLHDAKSDVQTQLATLTEQLASAHQRIVQLEEALAGSGGAR